MLRCRRRAAERQLFTIHYSFFIRLQGASLEPCPICAPHFFFSLLEKKKRAAPGAKEKEGLRVQTKMDPCFDKRFFCKAATPVPFGADLNAPCFSFRYRFPGARRTRGSPAAGGGAGWPRSGQTEGGCSGFR